MNPKYSPAVEALSSIKLWDEITNDSHCTIFSVNNYRCYVYTYIGFIFVDRSVISDIGYYKNLSLEEFLDSVPDKLGTELLFHLDLFSWTCDAHVSHR